MAPRAAATTQVLTFAAGGQNFAIGAEAVAEVVQLPRITRVPQSPRALIGLANLRGRVAPILSVDALMGGAGDGAASRVIVLERSDPIGLAVDRVDAMREVTGRQDDAAGGAELVQSEDGVARLLNLDRLLAGAFNGHAPRAKVRASGPAAAVAKAEAASDDVAFLQFEVAGQSYALPLEQVREVTPIPAGTTALPHTDAAMAGVMPLRGELLALVSLRAVLGLPGQDGGEAAQVVVAALGEATLGLLVDRVRAILRVREREVGAVPAVLNRGAGEARIDAIVRTPEGLVSVLAAERILQEESVAQMIAEGAGRGAHAAGPVGQDSSGGEQFVLFRLGEETYGLPISAVVEVVRLPEAVTRVPRAPDFVAGVMNHRGAAVPLIDQRRRFATPGAAQDRQGRVVIARLDDLVAGFVVDGVERILSLSAADLQAAPDLAAADTPIFDRIATLELEGRLVLLVDPRQLLDQAERDIVRALAEAAAEGA